MSFETIFYEKNKNIGVLTINRPKALNAINVQMLMDLDKQLDEVDSDRDLRVLIITGGGEKSFVAGADISEMNKMNIEQAKEFAKRGQGVMRRLEIFKVPVIAAVNGFALGGGTELACACDFIIASEKARFGQPEVLLGLMPGFGGTQRLSRYIGLGKARQLIYTGEQIDAKTAYEWGLVNKVVSPADLMPEVMKIAEAIVKGAPLGIAGSKEAINDGYDVSLDKGLGFELDLFCDLFETDDVKEGTKAFLEKRVAQFHGE